MITLYARKEGAYIGIYRDAELTDKFCAYPRDYSNCPDRRNKTVTLNCYKWKLEWV